ARDGPAGAVQRGRVSRDRRVGGAPGAGLGLHPALQRPVGARLRPTRDRGAVAGTRDRAAPGRRDPLRRRRPRDGRERDARRRPARRRRGRGRDPVAPRPRRRLARGGRGRRAGGHARQPLRHRRPGGRRACRPRRRGGAEPCAQGRRHQHPEVGRQRRGAEGARARRRGHRRAGPAPAPRARDLAGVKARSVPEIASALRREAEVRPAAWRAERAVAKAGRDGTPVLLGPFLGEIGYELEYWIPFLRRLLREHRIAPEQATVMTRGGAALWYRDFAAQELDVLQLLSPEEYLPRLEERRRDAGDLKQLRVGRLDRELVALAHERLGAFTLVHPGLMFTRLRGLWFRDEPLDTLWPQVEYRRLDVEPGPL